MTTTRVRFESRGVETVARAALVHIFRVIIIIIIIIVMEICTRRRFINIYNNSDNFNADSVYAITRRRG